MSRVAAVPVAALAVSAALIVVYLGLGGASYQPLAVADPCEPRALTAPRDTEEALERLALSALDGAACELQVTREELVLALGDPGSLDRFAEEHEISPAQVEAATREGLLRAIDDARDTGLISGLEALLLSEAAERLPVSAVLDLVREADESGLLDLLESTDAARALDLLGGLAGL